MQTFTLNLKKYIVHNFQIFDVYHYFKIKKRVKSQYYDTAFLCNFVHKALKLTKPVEVIINKIWKLCH